MLREKITRSQAQEIDRRAVEEFGLPSIVLMENAGRQVADRIQDRWPLGLVAICCGTGNNGGDGFVVARHLDLRGVPVRIVLCGPREKLSGDALVNFEVAEKSKIPLTFLGDFDAEKFGAQLSGAAVIVDALLGTGMRGDPRPPLDAIIRQVNQHPAAKVAVDLPSGLNCDTGECGNTTVTAEETYTFVAEKSGFGTGESGQHLGHVYVLDIGAPRCLVEEVLSRSA